jgi:hypothetical protein
MGDSERQAVPAWQGESAARIVLCVKALGFESYDAFLHANPGVSYDEMARLLGEGDLAPVQFERLHAASTAADQRAVAVLDSLARYLRGALKKGWGVGKYWRAI